jgi:nicotinamide/nicotinate riboside kinase
MSTAQPTLLGLSGPSCSGKTTIARLLTRIFPGPTPLIHEDDFFRPEGELPTRAGHVNWDCAAALDIAALVATLRHARERGALPAGLESKEAQNTVGERRVSEECVERLRGVVEAWMGAVGAPAAGRAKGLVVVDGFLLFGEGVTEVRELLDVKLLLRATFDATTRRRKARNGYVTLEGFWVDPEGYAEEVVWPAYVEEHGFMFVEGDVEGEAAEEVVQRLGVNVCPRMGEWGLEKVLEWVVSVILAELEKLDRH